MLETPQNAASYDSSLLTLRMQNQQQSIRAPWGKTKKVVVGAQARSTA